VRAEGSGADRGVERRRAGLGRRWGQVAAPLSRLETLQFEGGGPPPAKDDRGDRGGASPLRRTAVVRAGHSVFTEPIGSVLRYAGKFGSSEIGTDRFLQKLGTEGVRYR
jgi:hypothetical protein